MRTKLNIYILILKFQPQENKNYPWQPFFYRSNWNEEFLQTTSQSLDVEFQKKNKKISANKVQMS